MPGYTYFAMLHALFGTAALITFWSAAWMKKGSPRHRAIGKVFLLTMCADERRATHSSPKNANRNVSANAQRSASWSDGP